jgi:hypothetical protein
VEDSIASLRPARHINSRLDSEATHCWLEQDLSLLSSSAYATPTSPGSSTAANELTQLCFELKPKAALLPLAEAIDGASALPLCRFCALQLCRARSDASHRASLYCPLRLFSGDRSLVRRALEELVLTPHNNLGIFVDGTLAYGKGEADVCRVLDVLDAQLAPIAEAIGAPPLPSSGIASIAGGFDSPASSPTVQSTAAPDDLADCCSDYNLHGDELLGATTGGHEFLAEAKPYIDGSECCSVARARDIDEALDALEDHRSLRALMPEIGAFFDARELAGGNDEPGAELASHAVLRLYLRAVEEVLLAEPLLARLSAAQAAADPAGIACVARAYERLLSACGGSETIVQRLVDTHARHLCALRTVGYAPELQLARDLSMVHNWLLSLTLRDCSVMLCLRPLPPGSSMDAAPPRHGAQETGTVSVMLDGGHGELLFEYSIGIVDLDQKPIGKVSKHEAEARDGAALRTLLGLPPAALEWTADDEVEPGPEGALHARAWACEGLRRRLSPLHEAPRDQATIGSRQSTLCSVATAEPTAVGERRASRDDSDGEDSDAGASRFSGDSLD